MSAASPAASQSGVPADARRGAPSAARTPAGCAERLPGARRVSGPGAWAGTLTAGKGDATPPPAGAPRRLPSALMVAGPTGSGKSAFALDRVCSCAGRHVINAVPDCGSTRAPGAHRPPRAPRRRRRRRPPPLRRPAGRGRGERGVVAGAGARGDGRRRGQRASCRSCAAGPASTSIRSRAGLSACRRFRLGAGGGAGAAGRRRRPGFARPELAAADPATAAELRPGDCSASPARWEVCAARAGAGRLAGRVGPEPRALAVRAVLLGRPRQALRGAVAARFDAMLAAGAIEEVRALLAAGSILLCRPCGRTAFRNSRRPVGPDGLGGGAEHGSGAHLSVQQAPRNLVSPPLLGAPGPSAPYRCAIRAFRPESSESVDPEILRIS